MRICAVLTPCSKKLQSGTTQNEIQSQNKVTRFLLTVIPKH